MLDGLNILEKISGPKRLRDLVKDIRSARTAAEERALINKECASIRDNFRSEKETYRCRNVAKLLYIHMLGYPAHFGQLECLKLIASSRFTDKRVGYLGAMLLLDEKTDVHLLLNNSLKKDLNHTTPYIVSLALTTLGSICSIEMCRDLAGEVERIIKSNNIYLKKKAALCAFRIIKKVPDLMEMFIPCTRFLIQEKNHGVMLATISLITEMCIISRDTLDYFRKQMIPLLIKTMKTLIVFGYSTDDSSKMSDPFLQVKILRLMRLLGHGDHVVSEQLNDILAQVATNTETSKNIGHAILYEIVLTIMGIESDPGLRVLAVNILGRFLLNTDKNIRYVALNTLKQVVNADYKAVQRHRATILECLKDNDVSIQRRAVDLCFSLINHSNVRLMIRDLLAYLPLCEDEFKGDVCSKIILAAEQFAPDKKWHFDAILQLLMIAGNHARDDVVSSFVALTSQMNSLHAYAVHHLYAGVCQDLKQQPLVQAAAWCIGEYGDLLCQELVPYENGNTQDEVEYDNPMIYRQKTIPRTETEILDVLAKALISPMTTTVTRQMILVALTKLAIRFSSDQNARIKFLVGHFATSMKLELQQRSVEYSAILDIPLHIQQGLLECMPAMTWSRASQIQQIPQADNSQEDLKIKLNQNQTVGSKDILDLLTDINTSPNTNNVMNLFSSNDNNPAPNDIGNLFNASIPKSTIQPFANNDGLQDLFNSQIASKTKIETDKKNIKPLSNALDSMLIEDLFGNAPKNGHIHNFKPMTVYNQGGIEIEFVFKKESSTCLIIETTSKNSSGSDWDTYELLAAVPKTLQIQLFPPSHNSLPSSESLFGSKSEAVKQTMKITNPSKNQLKMRVKLDYTIGGTPNTILFQVDDFPTDLWL